MKEKTVKDHEGKKHPADTARPGGAAYAPHDEGAEKLAAESTGDNRTPELERERPLKEKTVKDHEGKKQPADTARPGGRPTLCTMRARRN
jgi:hypothetical protein